MRFHRREREESPKTSFWRRLFCRTKNDEPSQSKCGSTKKDHSYRSKDTQPHFEIISKPPQQHYYEHPQGHIPHGTGRSESHLPQPKKHLNSVWNGRGQHSSPELVHENHVRQAPYHPSPIHGRPMEETPGIPSRTTPSTSISPIFPARKVQTTTVSGVGDSWETGNRLTTAAGRQITAKEPFASHGKVTIPTSPNLGTTSTDMVFTGATDSGVYRTFSKRDRRLSSQFPDTPIQAAPCATRSPDPHLSQVPPIVVTHAPGFLPQSETERRRSIVISPTAYTIYEKHNPHSLSRPHSPSRLESLSDAKVAPETPYSQLGSKQTSTFRQNGLYKPSSAIAEVNADDESVDEEFLPEPARFSFASDSTASLSAAAAKVILLEINYNERYDRIGEPPFWYIKEPDRVPIGDPKHLCGTCRHINISHLYSQRSSTILPPASEYIRLGTLVEIIAKSDDCGLCHFIMRIIAREITTKHLGPQFTLTEMSEEFFTKYMGVEAKRWEEYSLFPIQFETRYHEYALYICRGQPPDPSSLMNARATMPGDLLGFREVHSCCRRPNTGRLVPNKTSMDTDWIKGMLKLCDERSFGWSGPGRNLVDMRVIDVHRMCIVGIEEGVRYLTLSYVW
jgi:hypothetical protein